MARICCDAVSFLALQTGTPNIEDLPAANSEGGALAPTLHASQQTGRSAELKGAVSNRTDQKVQVVLHHVAESLEHDVHAEGSAEAWRSPVEDLGGRVVGHAVLDDEDPDPHKSKAAGRHDEAIANTCLDGLVSNSTVGL